MISHGELIAAIESDPHLRRSGGPRNVIAAFTRQLADLLSDGDCVDVNGLGHFGTVDGRVVFRASPGFRDRAKASRR